ncbi:helicase-exonuclease AddAB subunit AddA [Tindallia californiensis]|uniref:ATP-dependent helicase/nuclease subunit A n=1 Tax=Tindallia californiensis TaxID=159292 RepID=A0A1H3K7U0_9FIRM|nr:helicase-exonuclease AddAB subunit AddA [Tindallia californiensis]SDY47668.1 DNA helicase/exodeoxyribonuclease V, subunit A [Tindallia californiensis]
MPKWTKEQDQAIKERNCNLLVSAAAGSGKTAVLVQRILDLVIHDGVDIDRMLIVTFTNAAASEMKERIARKMLEASGEYPEKREEIRRQLALLNRAYIMTMHSFCLKVLRSHFHLGGLDPSFRVGKETEVTLLKQEAMNKTLESFYQEANPTYYRLIESFCDMKNDLWLEAGLLKLHSFIQSQPEPLEWLHNQVESFDIDKETMMKKKWIESLFDILMLRLDGMINQIEMALYVSEEPGGPEVYAELLHEEVQKLEEVKALCKARNENAFELVKSFGFKRLPAAKEVDEDKKVAVQKMRDLVKKDFKALQEQWFFREPEEWAADIKMMKEPMRVLRDLVEAFHHSFRVLKSKKNIVDFNDLEHMTLKILKNQEAADYYKNQFQYIFIDEYQDSNRVQEAITDRIKRKDNLFMVGDVKQSIYRFRLAEPGLFMEKQRSFVNKRGAINKRIDLNRNFRSGKEIIDGVNYLFERLMTPFLGEMEYTEEVKLLSGDVIPVTKEAQPVELHILDKKKMKREEDSLLKDWTDQELEAKMTAGKIQDLLKTTIYDAQIKKQRKVQYRDIVILMRSTRRYLQIYEDILMEEGIPVFGDSAEGFFETVEVQVFINLLKLIDNIRQDIALISVLRSPVGGFTSEELSKIRLMDQGSPFYLCFMRMNELNHDNPLVQKVKSFLSKINHWRSCRDISLSAFIWQIMNESGYYAFVAAMPGGQQRQANLRILEKRAEEFEENQDGSIYGFLQYIDKLKRGGSGDLGVAKLISSNNDVIRIMSIHKSKGLEFPVVLLVGTGRKFNLRDAQEKLLLHKDLGLGPICAEPEKRVYRNTMLKNIIKEKIKQESLSEELRILYVAATRAQQKLVFIGSVNDPFNKWEQWANALHPYQLAKGQCFLDWIGPALAAEYSIKEERMGFCNSQWDVQLWKKEDLVLSQKKEESESVYIKNLLKKDPEKLPQKDPAYVKKRLEWVYPYQRDTVTQTKLSVSDMISHPQKDFINRGGALTPSLIKKPLFMTQERELTRAEKGTIFHYVIQQLDFKQYEEKNNMASQIDWMLQTEMISREEAEAIDTGQIEAFLESPLGKRMIKAEYLMREWPFLIQQELNGSTVMVQGIVDACFLEKNHWIIVDYKTDSIKEKDVDRWKEKYRQQIELYTEAVEQLTDNKVKEKWLFSLTLNKAIEL